MKYLYLLICGFVLSLPVPFAWADGAGQADLELGAYLSAECVTCHRINAETEGIPRINGMDPEHFVVAMQAYKQKDRAHPIMQMMAARLNDDEIAALAAYFGSAE